MQASQTSSQQPALRLTALLLASLALSLWYGLAIPLGEGPDEPAHFDYVLYLAREGRLPAPGATLDHPGEAHQPPLAYLLAVPLVAWLPAEQQQIELGENPRWSWAGGSEPAAYFRRTAELLPSQGLILAWRLTRGLSAVLGALTVALTYLLARRLGLAGGVALGAAALMAALPQFAFHHGLVSNDPLLWMLSAATLVWLVPSNKLRASGHGLATAPPPARRDSRFEIIWPLGLGALIGLALLTKASAVVLLPPAALAIWLRARSGLLQRPLRAAGLAGLMMLSISGWWFWNNLRRSGDPWGLEEFRSTFATAPFDPSSAEHWLAAGRAFGTSLVARFGWANLPAPPAVYWLAALIALAALAGSALAIARGHRPSAWAGLLLLMLATTLGWVFAFAITAGQVAGQGRFLFPALPVLALGVAWGLARLQPQPIVLGGAAVALLATALLLPVTTIRPAYRWLVTQPVADAPMLARFDGPPGVLLRGVSYQPEVQAGETLPVTLTWHVLERPGRSWTVFVHLARTEVKQPFVAADRQPLDGAFPMLAWTSGDWIRYVHQVPIPEGLPPGQYLLRVGLFDPSSGGRRTGAFDGQRLLGDYVELGPVQVTGAP